MSILILHCDGDPSVGIPPSSTEVDLCVILGKEEKDVRADIAKGFVELFTDIWDGKVTYFYDDECPECGSYLNEENKCTNKRCYNNYNNEENEI